MPRTVADALAAAERLWPLDGAEPEAVVLEPGDVVVMDPSLPHTSGLNREGALRYAVYFRFLTRSER